MFSGAEFHDRLDQICKKNGTNISAFLISIGKGKSLKGSIKKAQTPNLEVAQAASEHFNVPIYQLLGLEELVQKEKSDLKLNAQEALIISEIRAADPQLQSIILRIVSAVLHPEYSKTIAPSNNDGVCHHAANNRESIRTRKHYKRVEGEAAAGVPITAVPEEDSFVSVPEKYLDERYFIIRARGKSMEDTIPDGACCVFKRDPSIDDGAIVLVQICGSTDQPDDTIKRIYRKERQVELRSDNPEFAPMLYPVDAVQVTGVLVDVLPFGQ